MYIAIEGVDGCGKTTQAQMLCERLGEKAVLTSEPDADSEPGRLLRIWLKLGLNPAAHLPMFLVDRLAAEAGRQGNLRHGFTIVSDRCFLSTLVYQSEVWPLFALKDMHMGMTLFPDVIVILDVPWEVVEDRLRRHAGRVLEYYETDRRLKRAVEQYQIYAERREVVMPRFDGIRIRVPVVGVDGVGKADDVHRRVLASIPGIM